MWSYCNIPRLGSNFYRQFTSKSLRLPLIDPVQSDTISEKSFGKPKETALHENLHRNVAYTYLKKQMLVKQIVRYDGCNLLCQFRNLSSVRFPDGNRSSAVSKHWTVIKDTRDKKTEAKLSTYTKSLLQPKDKSEPGNDISDIVFSKERKSNENARSENINTTDNAGKECKSSETKRNITSGTSETFQFFRKSSQYICRGQPPSKKLEEILISLREWEKNIGWFSSKSGSGGMVKPTKENLNQMAIYSSAMQKKNTMRNVKRHLGVDHMEMSAGLADKMKRSSIVKAYLDLSKYKSENFQTTARNNPKTMEREDPKTLIHNSTTPLQKVNQTNSMGLNSYNFKANEAEAKLQLMELIKKTEQTFNKNGSKKTAVDTSTSVENLEYQDLYRKELQSISCVVQKIDSIMRQCENLRRIYLEQLKSKSSRSISGQLNPKLKDLNSLLGPQLNVVFRKMKNLGEENIGSPASLLKEKEINQKFNKTANTEILEKDKHFKCKEKKSQSNLTNPESGSPFKELSKKCWEAVSKTRSPAIHASKREEEFLKKCQETVGRKNIRSTNRELSQAKHHSLDYNRKISTLKNETRYRKHSKIVTDLEEKVKNKCQEQRQMNIYVKDANKKLNELKGNKIGKDIGLHRYILTARPLSDLIKIIELNVAVLGHVLGVPYQKRWAYNSYLPNQLTFSETYCQQSRNVSEIYLYSESKLGIVEWLRKLTQMPPNLRPSLNLFQPLHRFRNGILTGNTQSSFKLLDLETDQRNGYDESKS